MLELKKNMIDLNSLIGEEDKTKLNSNQESISNEENSINIINEKQSYETIVVHITGEVKKQGVIYLEKGARIIDAIKEAGGETKQADLSQVNLAYELQDGQKLYIPNKNEKISEYIIEESGQSVGESKSSAGLSGNKEDNSENIKVNINTATLEELDNLPGIGPAIAEKIIEYREENGNFKTIEDIQNVKGIGESKYNDIKEKIIV